MSEHYRIDPDSLVYDLFGVGWGKDKIEIMVETDVHVLVDHINRLPEHKRGRARAIYMEALSDDGNFLPDGTLTQLED